jgi:hypothetical protein
LAPSRFVAEAAKALRGAEPESLFSAEEDSALEDYREWRQVYLQAAERGEAVLVY